MYKEFFGLRANPFNVNPDPRYLFLTRHTEEALACLTYGIQSRKGFVLLTGEVGTGKTTLINKLLEWLRLQQVATAFIFNSRMNVPQFMDYMMTNFETFTEKLLQIVLVGQPELEQKLKQPHLRQLRQRLTLRAKTHPLSLEETKAYVAQRLRIAGSNGQQVFDPEALVTIHRHANGIPRVVNLICEHCLVSAFVDQQKLILPNVVNAVARDFDLGDNNASAAMTVPAQTSPVEKFDVVEVLRTLATLADRLRDSPQDFPKER